MMQTLIIKIKNTENLEFIVQLLSKFSFVTEIKKEKSNKKNKYDFSDIAGKLEWTGNALDEQKKLKKKKTD